MSFRRRCRSSLSSSPFQALQKRFGNRFICLRTDPFLRRELKRGYPAPRAGVARLVQRLRSMHGSSRRLLNTQIELYRAKLRPEAQAVSMPSWLPRGKCKTFGSEAAQDTFSDNQISLPGGNRSGSSSVAVASSMAAGLSSWLYVSGVPHLVQKARITAGDERKVETCPESKVNCSEPTTIHATDGAPLARRQLLQ